MSGEQHDQECFRIDGCILLDDHRGNCALGWTKTSPAYLTDRQQCEAEIRHAHERLASAAIQWGGKIARLRERLAALDVTGG